MSLTVKDILKLPSLRSAKVVAGRQGLEKVVSSVSVLEYANVDEVQADIFGSIDFFGNEIVITAFSNIKDDVEAQLKNIRILSEAGEIGMILYYVGIILPKIDRRLIELADRLGFVLISMPENQLALRYSEVICEVMAAVYDDQGRSASLSMEILDQVARLPKHQQNVETVIKIIRDRLRATLIITDSNLKVLNEVTWPRIMPDRPSALLKTIELPEPGIIPTKYTDKEGTVYFVYRATLEVESGHHINIFMFKDGEPVASQLWNQTAESVRLALNLWSRHHDQVDMSELVKAILQDEPMKMHRLAEIFQVNVKEMHSLWIIHPEGEADKTQIAAHEEELRNIAACFTKSFIADFYQGDFLFLPVGPDTKQEAEDWAEELMSAFEKYGIDCTVTCCSGLPHTHLVQEAFIANQKYLRDAKAIFPRKKYFTHMDIDFAKECRIQAERGEKEVSGVLAPLEPLKMRKDGEELLDTLSVFLLDGHSSLASTAQLQFLHKNTIKYRVQKLSDWFGFTIGDMPESFALYKAAAVRRLLQ